MTMRQTAYLIRVLFSVLLLLAAAACRKDLGPDAGVPAEEGGMYLSISISADGGAAPAFKSPAPGENGDGAEAGTGAENVINDLNVFFFQGELDADNRLGINSTTDPFLTCLYISEDELQSVQSVVGQYKYTFTREISSLGLEAGSTYDILVVANAGSSLGGIQTLAELRECIFEDKDDTGIRQPEDLIQGFDLMMSSASDASVTISDTNTSSSKADHVSVNLERMVARVDIKGNVNYDVEVEGRQDQVYIEYYLIVNNYKAGTYAFKRVTESLESDRTVYLGDESAVIPDGMTYGEVGNYVVDPKTLTPDDAGGNAYQNYFPTLDVGNPQDPYFNDVFQKLPEAGTGSTEFSKSTYVFENVLKSETLEQTALDDFCTGIIFRANYVPYGFKPGDSYYWYDNEAYKTLSGIGIEGVTEDNFENYGIRYYYLGWCLKQGGLDGSEQAFAEAAACCPDYCFPNRLEAVLALQCAIKQNPKDPKAPYYLGNLYFEYQPQKAVALWEKSLELDDTFYITWRNLALAYFNKKDDKRLAVECMERAFALDTTDARILMELDQLYKRMQRPHAERLAFLQQYPQLIAGRDDLLLEEITLLNQTGDYTQAKELLDGHIFHPWEGGEGKVSAQYQFARVELAKNALAEHRWQDAVSLLDECLVYPHHLGEGKLYGAQENDFYYFLGCAYEGMGDAGKAKECWEKATAGPTEPVAALYYNDAKPDKIFYQGLALLKLGRKDEANGRFYKLTNYGEKHLFDKVKMDYFAVSLPDLLIWEDSLDLRNEIHCKYMLALGYYGLGKKEKSLRFLSEVERLDNNHQGIQAFRSLINLMSL